MAWLTRGLTIASLTAVLATGCGVKKEVHQKALDDLAATRAQLDEAERDRNAKAKQLAELEKDLQTTTADRDKTAADKQKLSKDMQATQAELEALRLQRDKAEERLKAFRQLNERFRALVDTGKLKVAFRNGQMVLELPSEVLFDSGKAEFSKKGEEALAEVLNILMEFKDRRFLIAGHTDNLKIRSSKYKNNWYLSTARAVSVVEFMIKSGFDAKNLAAAGYGEFDPVSSNDTEEGRQRNRRIEIILIPDLSELPNLTSADS